MTKELREIIHNRAVNPENFIINKDRKVIEIIDGKPMETYFYQDEEGKYYDEAAWKIRQEEIALAAKKEKEEAAARAQELKEQEAKKAEIHTLELAPLEEDPNAQIQKTKNPNTKLYILLALLFIGSFAGTYFIIKAFKGDDTEVEQEAITTEDVGVQVPVIFGNGLITGDEVRIRKGPSLQDSIVGLFPKEGERILILQQPTDSIPWAQIRKEDGLEGWVFGKYVKESVVE